MISKKSLSRPSHLYAILDRQFLSKRKILLTVSSCLRAGIDMIQLRDKKSSTTEAIAMAMGMKKLADRHNTPLIINDRLDVALASGADGLHLGQGDVGISVARKMMGKKKLIGVTVKSLEQAKRAKSEGADYLGVGPVFKTPIKSSQSPKGFSLLDKIKKMGIPFFAIGGIDSGNIDRLIERGFRNIAVIRAICRARDPYNAVRRLKGALVFK